MVAVVLGLAVVLIVIGVVVFVMVGRRNALQPVGGARVAGPARPYFEPDSGSTGAVEVIAAPSAVAPSTSTPPPLFDLDLEPVLAQPAPEIRWSKQFDPRSGGLDDTARLRLIGDLGVVAKEWCVPLLAQAYVEERRPANRQAALIALAACRSRTAVATYRLALASGDAAEQAIATDALADLEPSPQSKPRTVVERR